MEAQTDEDMTRFETEIRESVMAQVEQEAQANQKILRSSYAQTAIKGERTIGF